MSNSPTYSRKKEKKAIIYLLKLSFVVYHTPSSWVINVDGRTEGSFKPILLKSMLFFQRANPFHSVILILSLPHSLKTIAYVILWPMPLMQLDRRDLGPWPAPTTEGHRESLWVLFVTPDQWICTSVCIVYGVFTVVCFLLLALLPCAHTSDQITVMSLSGVLNVIRWSLSLNSIFSWFWFKISARCSLVKDFFSRTS
jgi:hypothetical protein